jgi:hypothetical protein
MREVLFYIPILTMRAEADVKKMILIPQQVVQLLKLFLCKPVLRGDFRAVVLWAES